MKLTLTKKFTFTIAFASLFLTALITLPIFAKEKVEDSDCMKDNVRQNIDPSEATEAEQYWTPEQMENAQPLPFTSSGSPKPVSEPQSPSTPEIRDSSSAATEDVVSSEQPHEQ